MPANLQRLHTALWSSYLGFRRLDRTLGFAPENRPLATEAVLRAIEAEVNRSPRERNVRVEVLGLAVWNLLEDYLVEPPPARYVALLERTLGLSIEKARQQLIERRTSALPPDPRLNRIVESKWTAEDDGQYSRGSLDLTVQRSYADLQGILHPERWTEVAPLWRGVSIRRLRIGHGHEIADPKANRIPRDRGWRAKGVLLLALPGGTRSAPKTLKGLFDADRTIGSRKSRVDFQVYAGEIDDPLICNGYLNIEKMEGRPGATRVQSYKRVRFPTGDLDRFRTQTLAYWMQSETLALALSTRRPPGAAGSGARKPKRARRVASGARKGKKGASRKGKKAAPRREPKRRTGRKRTSVRKRSRRMRKKG